MKPFASRTNHFIESIFSTMSKKANEVGAINLAQGFPDFDGPDWVKNLAKEAIESGHNQYAPSPGVPILRENLSRIYRDNYKMDYEPNSEITVTNGATEAIFISILALIEPGDEVIVFEPFYDSYVATIEMAGGIVKPVTLHSPNFGWDEGQLKGNFSEKTKLVILNNPHNPSGKVYSRGELSAIAEMVKKYDCFVMSDEVYEYLTFDGIQHIPFASLPDMKERTLTISSLGKTFGLTGWKIGWVCSSDEISYRLRMIHQFNTFSVSSSIQVGCAKALESLPDYIPKFQKQYQDKRDYFFLELEKLGFRPIKPEGTYFILCPIDHLTSKSDVEYSMDLIVNKKVATIPPSSFYLKSDEGSKHLRFCFAKKDETLKKAVENLKI